MAPVRVVVANMKLFSILSFQTKYTLIDEQDIPLVENYAFEVNFWHSDASILLLPLF